MPAVITLTTDFGADDPFVGIMKGVMLSIHPRAEIIDLTHGIEPHNVLQAAWVLKAAVPYFPKNTVHVAVVDPGIGGQRRPLVVQSGAHTFVGPDNGVFTSMLNPQSRCFELTQKKYFLKNVSATFHGRDIFAPVAAWIANGTPLKSLGRPVQNPKTLEMPQPAWNGTALTGEVIYIDRFGNATTNISREMISQHCPHFQKLTVKLEKTAIHGLATHYSEVSPDKAGAIINSWDALEIFKRESHAARSLKLKPGRKIQVMPDS